MDFLDVQLDDMTLVQKANPTYDFPVVTFRKHNKSFITYFNQHAGKALNNCRHVKIYATAEYVVFSPVHKKDTHSFMVHYISSDCASVSCVGLERFRLEDKTYKLYKTEKGFAIKINDPIKNRKEKNEWESLF